MTLDQIKREINRLREEATHLEFLIACYGSSASNGDSSSHADFYIRLSKVQEHLLQLEHLAVQMERKIV